MILGLVIAIAVILSNAGCSSKQYIMKDCKQVLDTDGKDTGERVCKKNNIWE